MIQSASLFVAPLANFGYEPRSTLIRNGALLVLVMVVMLFFPWMKRHIRIRRDSRNAPPPVTDTGGQRDTHLTP
jgi:hypothetical protein